MNNTYIVIGAGGHATVVADALLAAGATVLGFTDANPVRHGMEICGRRVLGDDTALSGYDAREVRLANGVGSIGAPTLRRDVQTRLEAQGWSFAGVHHPTAIVSRFAHVDEGAQLLAGSVVQARAHIGAGCIVNTRAVVEHDAELGAYTHVASGAIVCGHVRVGAGSHIGAGAVVRQGIVLGPGSLVAAGAAVVRDHDGEGWLMGVPARGVKGKGKS